MWAGARAAPEGSLSGTGGSPGVLACWALMGGRMGLHCVFMGTRLTAPPLLLQDVPCAHGRGDTSPSRGLPRAPAVGGQARWQCCAEPWSPRCAAAGPVMDVCGRVPAKCSPQHGLAWRPRLLGRTSLPVPRESSLPCSQDLGSQVQQTQTLNQGPLYPLVVLRPQHDL